MKPNRDFVELLQSFDDHDVGFLLASIKRVEPASCEATELSPEASVYPAW
jgi:hypothetical protein